MQIFRLMAPPQLLRVSRGIDLIYGGWREEKDCFFFLENAGSGIVG